MTIKYTKHARYKFKDLSSLGIYVSRKLVRKVITQPIHLDKESDRPKIIASGNLDSDHILRVVYKEDNDIILVITFYPSRKGRYLL